MLDERAISWSCLLCNQLFGMFSHYNVDSSIVVSSGWLCATIPHALFCQLVIARISHILGLGLWQWIICELCVLLNSTVGTRGSAGSIAVLFPDIWQGFISYFYRISEMKMLRVALSRTIWGIPGYPNIPPYKRLTKPDLDLNHGKTLCSVF